MDAPLPFTLSLAGEAPRVAVDPPIAVTARGLSFPPARAFLRLLLNAEPGAYRMRLARYAGGVRIELLTSLGTVPLPQEEADGDTLAVFAVAERLAEVRLMPVEHGPFEPAAIVVEPTVLPQTLLAPHRIGPVTVPRHGAPAPLPQTPASWQGIEVVAADGVTEEAGGFRVARDGAVALTFAKPLPPGAALFGRFLDRAGRAALVAPQIAAPDGTETPLREVAGGFAAVIPPAALADGRLVVRLRERAGFVQVEDLSVRARRPGKRRRMRMSVTETPRRGPKPRGATGPVTIVTATKDAPHHLARFLRTLRRTEGAFDLVLIDNGTTEPRAQRLLADVAAEPWVTVLRDDRPFNFAAVNNRGAEAATGRTLVFANNDVAFVAPGWLGALTAALAEPDVGIAGARLLYPRLAAPGGVQHAGLVLAGEARVRHLERHLWRYAPGHGGRQRVGDTVSAVTGALMAIDAEHFRRLGGFDAKRYPLLYNDVDLCLRSRRTGLRTVFAAAAVAVHHESATIGPRGATLLGRGGPLWRLLRSAEADRFRCDHADGLDCDPCHPPACDPNAADFRLRPDDDGRA